jgi:hypothetical protein
MDTLSLTSPVWLADGLIRPPGHHASADSCWGFCYFNNMAIAIEKLKNEARIEKALVLDIDLHYGDGTVNILGDKGYVTLINPSSNLPADFIGQVDKALAAEGYDVIGISAGFDYAREDWGQLLAESDYNEIGRMVRETARKTGAGFFAILEWHARCVLHSSRIPPLSPGCMPATLSLPTPPAAPAGGLPPIASGAGSGIMGEGAHASFHGTHVLANKIRLSHDPLSVRPPSESKVNRSRRGLTGDRAGRITSGACLDAPCQVGWGATV